VLSRRWVGDRAPAIIESMTAKLIVQREPDQGGTIDDAVPSVNPARSLGPAVFVGGTALAQVWLFLVFPTLGGLAAGWLVKSKALNI
jgi:Major intrinsic protein